MQKEDCNHYIEATLKTWEKDSHGLHDYELSAKSKEFKVSAKNSFCLGRKKTGNWFFSTSSSVNGMPLLSVINIKGKYFVDNWFQKQTTTCYDDYRNWNWIPTIAYDNFTPFRNCHKVEIGDVIKFGRIVFEVCYPPQILHFIFTKMHAVSFINICSFFQSNS